MRTSHGLKIEQGRPLASIAGHAGSPKVLDNGLAPGSPGHDVIHDKFSAVFGSRTAVGTLEAVSKKDSEAKTWSYLSPLILAWAPCRLGVLADEGLEELAAAHIGLPLGPFLYQRPFVLRQLNLKARHLAEGLRRGHLPMRALDPIFSRTYLLSHPFSLFFV